jgi:hypothetical protein
MVSGQLSGGDAESAMFTVNREPSTVNCFLL